MPTNTELQNKLKKLENEKKQEAEAAAEAKTELESVKAQLAETETSLGEAQSEVAEATKKQMAAMEQQIADLTETQKRLAPAAGRVFSKKPVKAIVFYAKQHGAIIEIGGLKRLPSGKEQAYVREIKWPPGRHMLRVTDEETQYNLLNSRALLQLRLIEVVPEQAVPEHEAMDQRQDGPRYAEGAQTASQAATDLAQTHHTPG